MADLTEEIVNAIIAGIGSSDIAIEQVLDVIEQLDTAGYVIVRERRECWVCGKPLEPKNSFSVCGACRRGEKWL